MKANRVMLQHYRIDDRHSNAFTIWKEMGGPQQPTEKQYLRLQRAGELTAVSSPEWVKLDAGVLHREVVLPRHSVSLIRLTW